MKVISSKTIAAFCSFARCTIAFDTLCNSWLTRFFLRRPYLPAMFFLILALLRLKERIAERVFSATCTAFDASKVIIFSSLPYVTFARFLSTPAIAMHSISATSLE